jgi:hypothetical protein
MCSGCARSIKQLMICLPRYCAWRPPWRVRRASVAWVLYLIVTAFISHYGIACHKRDATQCTNVWDARSCARCAINIAPAPHILARARPPGSQRGRPDSVAAGGRAVCWQLAPATQCRVRTTSRCTVRGVRSTQQRETTSAHTQEHPLAHLRF